MLFSWWLVAILTCKSFVKLRKRCERLQLVEEKEKREEKAKKRERNREKERKRKRKRGKREEEIERKKRRRKQEKKEKKKTKIKQEKKKTREKNSPPDKLSHHDSKKTKNRQKELFCIFSSKVQNLSLFSINSMIRIR